MHGSNNNKKKGKSNHFMVFLGVLPALCKGMRFKASAGKICERLLIFFMIEKSHLSERVGTEDNGQVDDSSILHDE